MRMKFSPNMTAVLGSWLILFSASAVAQSTQVVLLGGYADFEGDQGDVCAVSGVAKESCSGPWNFDGRDESGSVSISGTAKYGPLTGKAKSKISVTDAYMPPVTTYSSSYNTFIDVLSFPTLPNGTQATLSFTVQLSGVGSVSNVSSSAPAEPSAYIG